MSDTANSTGGVMPRDLADSVMARRAEGESSAIFPTSVVSMWLDSGVMIMTALRDATKSGDAFTIPFVAGGEKFLPVFGSGWFLIDRRRTPPPMPPLMIP